MWKKDVLCRWVLLRVSVVLRVRISMIGICMIRKMSMWLNVF